MTLSLLTTRPLSHHPILVEPLRLNRHRTLQCNITFIRMAWPNRTIVGRTRGIKGASAGLPKAISIRTRARLVPDGWDTEPCEPQKFRTQRLRIDRPNASSPNLPNCGMLLFAGSSGLGPCARRDWRDTSSQCDARATREKKSDVRMCLPVLQPPRSIIQRDSPGLRYQVGKGRGQPEEASTQPLDLNSSIACSRSATAMDSVWARSPAERRPKWTEIGERMGGKQAIVYLIPRKQISLCFFRIVLQDRRR
jgi:hypothetical protein